MKLPIAILFLFIGILSFSQKTDSILKNKTIEAQFEELYRKSSTYKSPETQTTYKVVKILKINELKSNVLDSLNTQKNSLTEKNNTLIYFETQTSKLKQSIASLETELQDAKAKRDGRSLFGVLVNKSAFSTILVISHTLLILLVAFFAFQFQKNAVTTKKAVSNFENLQDEFEQHKKTSLKRYQEVNRKLQDELNKKWKKDNKG